ncbi:MAG: hypothetical protein COT81_02125 [Candidatus Buchananbacteria bacterium CG10_big_fil_rev_8_21_14_0_10_42_9]|uniref:Rubrerythrin diiron-binding domain-containing protein n=1 Tax=Candidatus Buchananbacteria bacterium CG10_big_fil_rev_8_21_14_0_10_42_9 TaxID=1974526 RepID=A0A2H0W1R3_9BACT|nr:MAG: hypothetical protein COT81_02125 [Candidatus Buchananbacteria bacterium CG10_big_fil_rev_8_21_14_0_10_42_9]
MPRRTIRQTDRAIKAEEDLISCYAEMAKKAKDPKVKSVIRDMMLMEEMNEVLLKAISQDIR